MTRPIYDYCSDWEIANLEENRENDVIVGVNSGGTPSTKNPYYWGGPILWLTPKEITNEKSYRFKITTERTITKNGMNSCGASVLPPNTVMLTKRAPIGKVCINKVPMSTNQGFLNFKCGNRILPEFLYYWLKCNKSYLEIVANGSTYLELYPNDLFEFEIGLPKIPEQKAITEILATTDDKIELNRQMNETLEALGATLFNYWFIDFEFPNEDGLPFKSNDGNMIFSEELDKEIPEDWEVKPFSECISINPTRKLSKGKVSRKIGMADLNPWQSYIETWNREVYGSGSKFKNGDVLFARITPSLEHGKTALVYFLDKNEVAFGTTEFIVFAPKIIESSFYIFHLARDAGVREKAISEMTGTSGRQRVPNDCFDFILIPLPHRHLIDKFNKIMRPLFEKINQNAIENSILIELRDFLIPKLVSGENRVKT